MGVRFTTAKQYGETCRLWGYVQVLCSNDEMCWVRSVLGPKCPYTSFPPYTKFFLEGIDFVMRFQNVCVLQ